MSVLTVDTAPRGWWPEGVPRKLRIQYPGAMYCNGARFSVDRVATWVRGRSSSGGLARPWKCRPRGSQGGTKRPPGPNQSESRKAKWLGINELRFARSSRVHEGNSTDQFAAVCFPLPRNNFQRYTYHVMSRGDQRDNIFLDDQDRQGSE